ncbi:MAG: fructose-1,6-bisphosphatase/inositol monophosphatase family enzyme [Myxococcota bacterium]|jgi:fructose-1,6-bisphosphatase/inositol monophosphatase family enzyme
MTDPHELGRACLERRRAGTVPGSGTPESVTDWQAFCVEAALEAGATVRASRARNLADLLAFKSDGSPATSIELDIERRLQRHLSRFCPEAALVAEELGGTLPPTGYAVAIDPIDGTWAFLSRTACASTTLVAIRDGTPFAAAVVNPATLEVVHASIERETELIQVGALGVPDVLETLPLPQGAGRVLLSLQPSRRPEIVAAMAAAWARSELGVVRSPGGSPAWALASAAKGAYTYANLWSNDPAAPYDLAAGALLVRAAGGEVVDLAGNPINSVCHRGPFVAGVEPAAVDRIRGLLCQALG